VSIAEIKVLHLSCSSLILSNISILASTAIQIDKITAAIPDKESA